MQLPTLNAASVKGKNVLVRTDYNEPIVAGQLKDTTRIAASLSTINFLLEQQCRVILLSHLGKPKSVVKEDMSLEPIVKVLELLLKREVVFIKEQNLTKVKEQLKDIPKTSVVLLENLRFHAGEEANNEAFATQLAALGEVYVNDAFSVSHRKHASVVAIKKHLPWFVGLHLQKEVKLLESVMQHPTHPFVLVVGGAKIKDKLVMIKNLITKVDKVLIGSATVPLFLAAQQKEKMQNRQGVDEHIVIAQQLLQTGKIILPVDYLVATNSGSKKVRTLEPEQHALDIGEESITLFEQYLAQASTIVWNGPLGKIEEEAYAKASKQIAATITKNKGLTLVGGGSTLEFLDSLGYRDKIKYVSTGGGALLQFLSGQTLPGLMSP